MNTNLKDLIIESEKVIAHIEAMPIEQGNKSFLVQQFKNKQGIKVAEVISDLIGNSPESEMYDNFKENLFDLHLNVAITKKVVGDVMIAPPKATSKMIQ